MSITPIFTFKAGICELDSANVVKPQSTPGYIYLYTEDELHHFCWRPRSVPHTEPELDLVMVPSDGSFLPYEPAGKAPTNGRIFALKFSSSSQRYLFYLQSHSQAEDGNPNWFSPRDIRLGKIVNALLQGHELDMDMEIACIPEPPFGRDGDDETMEDVEGVDRNPGHDHGGGSGGAGPDATGGDIREEGQGSRDGGADGGRAASSLDPSSVVQGFLNSLGGEGQNQSQAQNPFTTLQDLLGPSSTLPFVEAADDQTVDNLLSYLPPPLLLLSQNVEDVSGEDANSEIVEAITMSLDISQKKSILRKVLHSPQFMQSLASLTMALRDGGLPSISEALKIPVENGGFLRRGGVPLGGGDAVKAFLEGARQYVKEKGSEHRMETD